MVEIGFIAIVVGGAFSFGGALTGSIAAAIAGGLIFIGGTNLLAAWYKKL